MSKQKNALPERVFNPSAPIDLRNEAMAILNAFKKRNQKKLKHLNDILLRLLVPNFSKTLFELTALSYILSKIASKPRFLSRDYDEQMLAIEEKIGQLIRLLPERNEAGIAQLFDEIENAIRDLEKGDPRFIQDIITKGDLKTAATIYAQGISLGVASEVTGMNKQDILSYAGKTMMFDRLKEEKTIHDRLQVAKRLVRK